MYKFVNISLSSFLLLLVMGCDGISELQPTPDQGGEKKEVSLEFEDIKQESDSSLNPAQTSQENQLDTNIEQTNKQNESISNLAQISGDVLYVNHCAACHGLTGQDNSYFGDLTKYTDVSILQTRIEQTMPPANIGDCINNCALQVAEYIIENFSTETVISNITNVEVLPNTGNSIIVDSTSNTENINNSENTVESVNTPTRTQAPIQIQIQIQIPTPIQTPTPTPTPTQTVAIVRDAGTVTLHRLNRNEYNNTIRDLLKTQQTPASTFPADDFGYGFDNIANVLSLSPLHVELMESTASKLAEVAAKQESVKSIAIQSEAENLLGSGGEAYTRVWNLFTNGFISDIFQIQQAGEYEFSARVWGTQGGVEFVNMDLLLDRLPVSNVYVPNTEDNPGLFKIRKTLPAGPVEFGVAFLNDFYDPIVDADRNLLVDWLRVEGPFNVKPVVNPYRSTLYSCNPASVGIQLCATQILSNFAKQSWRRPLISLEINELVSVFNTAINQGDDFDTGIALAVKAILLSPHFIFRVELDPNTTALSHSLTAHELATRLSYFLWSSMPDNELLALADNGLLLQKSVISQQVMRMINDPKAEAIAENFAGQWLHIRKLANVTPDDQLFPNWDDELKISLKTESIAFFNHLVRENISMQNLLVANYSFINTKLAYYYGAILPSTDFEKTALPINRVGYLTQGGFLAVTSHPTRTSIVKRGKWVLDNLLCSEPPPPPPDIVGIPVTGTPGASLREIMEAHRSNPVCAGCHASMDPIGFSLEHYDAAGYWREQDNGFAIDDSGQLPNGIFFQGANGLAQVIVNDPRYSACVVEKLFTYALGRAPLPTDAAYLEEINTAWVAQGMQFSNLANLIAQSDPFTTRYNKGNPQ